MPISLSTPPSTSRLLFVTNIPSLSSLSSSLSPLSPLAFYNDAREAYVIDRQLITANYLFSFWFPVDVVSSIPIDTFVAISSGTFQVD